MKVTFERVALTTLVIPEGRLDFGTAAEFQKHLEQAIAGAGRAPAAVIIDCAALEYVSSAGLRVFLMGARAVKPAGVVFALCSLKPSVREVFDISGFNRIITVHADRAIALAHVDSSA